MDAESVRKLKALKNRKVEEQVTRFLELCKPAKATVITDSPGDVAYVRQLAIELGEEAPLKMKGHTIHYDGYYDQARDKENTRTQISYFYPF
jgi:phosphoenolpyruvate carboxykinase (GTP)